MLLNTKQDLGYVLLLIEQYYVKVFVYMSDFIKHAKKLPCVLN